MKILLTWWGLRGIIIIIFRYHIAFKQINTFPIRFPFSGGDFDSTFNSGRLKYPISTARFWAFTSLPTGTHRVGTSTRFLSELTRSFKIMDRILKWFMYPPMRIPTPSMSIVRVCRGRPFHSPIWKLKLL